MPNLVEDTQVEATSTPGRYAASLSPNWAVWGPNGGYLAALALQAAYRESRHARPAVFQCHFLAVGEFAAVDIEVTRLGGGKRAESLHVDIRQGEKLLVAATVWMPDPQSRPGRSVSSVRTGSALDARRREGSPRERRAARLRFAPVDGGPETPRNVSLETQLTPQPGLRRGPRTRTRARHHHRRLISQDLAELRQNT